MPANGAVSEPVPPVPQVVPSPGISAGPSPVLSSLPVSNADLDEIALYDRQIRLWGVQAQEKIRSANILLISMKALANEIAKNLVLAGIGSLTLLDHETVTANDLGAQFFISDENVGMNRAEAAAPQIRKLNPRVQVIIDTEHISSKSSSYYQAFDIVIATDMQPSSLDIINTVTRFNHKPLYAAGVHGFYGYIFSDLIQHDFVVQRERSNRATILGPETRTRSVIDVKTKKENGKNIELVTKRELYSTWLLASSDATLSRDYTTSKRRLRNVTPLLSCLRGLWEFQVAHDGRTPAQNSRKDLAEFVELSRAKHTRLGLPTETLGAEFVRVFLQNVGTEMAPVTAVLGGQLAQDVINVLGKRQQPIQNMVLLDGESMVAPVYALHPDGGLGDELLWTNVASATVNGQSTVGNGGTPMTMNVPGTVVLD